MAWGYKDALWMVEASQKPNMGQKWGYGFSADDPACGWGELGFELLVVDMELGEFGGGKCLDEDRLRGIEWLGWLEGLEGIGVRFEQLGLVAVRDAEHGVERVQGLGARADGEWAGGCGECFQGLLEWSSACEWVAFQVSHFS